MRAALILLIFMLLLSCSKTDNAVDTSPKATASSDAVLTSAAEKGVGISSSWDLQSSGEGVSLALRAAEKQAIIRFFCPSAENRLTVNVQSFQPIGSEERLTIGSGNYATTLVADTGGDLELGGVSGTSEIPDDLGSLFSGQVSANYGAQNSGPHIAPPPNLSKAFVTACSDGRARNQTTQRYAKLANACKVQDGKLLSGSPRRAIGTEPFWGARIEGRCVHYTHMEDQKGTRIWTRYSQNQLGEIWSGALGGKLFELKVRNEPGCSDGMSDKRYPMAVELKVGGEIRKGCAEPT